MERVPQFGEPGFRSYLDALRDEGFEQGFKKGRVEALAQAIIQLMAVRQIPMSPAGIARVRGCTDSGQLDRWLIRVVSVSTEDALFAE